MSRALQLSSISSYSLAGGTQQGTDGGGDDGSGSNDAGSSGAGGGLAALTDGLLRTGAGGGAAAAAAVADALDGAEVAAYDEEGEEGTPGLGLGLDFAPPPASAETDPYAATAAGSAFYPSGLLGTGSADPSHYDEEQAAADEEEAEAAAQRAASERDEHAAGSSRHDEGQEGEGRYEGQAVAGMAADDDDDLPRDPDHRFDEAEMPTGWEGSASFREADDEEEQQFAAEQRRRADEEEQRRLEGHYDDGDDDDDGAQDDGQGDGAHGGAGRKRGRDQYDAYGVDDDSRDEEQQHAQHDGDDQGSDGGDAYDAPHDRHNKRPRYADDEGEEGEDNEHGRDSGDDDEDRRSDSGASGSASGSDREGEGDGHDDGGRRERRRSRRRDYDSQDPSSEPQGDGMGGGGDASSMLYHSAAAAASSFLPSAAAAAQYANYSPATPIHSARPHPPSGVVVASAPPGSHRLSYAPTTPSTNHGGQQHHAHGHAHYPSHSPSSAQSPHYAYSSPHHASFSPSPHLGPTSPRISHWGGGGGGGYYGSAPFGSTSGASSPRQDTISSVTHRVELLARSGRLGSLLHTAGKCNQEVAGWASAGSAQLVPDYNHLAHTSPLGAARSSSKQALISIDQHLLRRFMLRVLDSDMLVRGVVCNKSASAGLVINIAEILWPQDKASEVLNRQQQAAQQLVAQMQQAQKGGPDAAAQAGEKPHTSAGLFFPPLSSFLGGISATVAAQSASSSSYSYSTAGSSSVAVATAAAAEAEPSYAVERALFSNFEVLAIHGECHLAEMQAPPPVAASALSLGIGAPPLAPLLGQNPSGPSSAPSSSAAAAALERFSLGDQVKALVISVDIHSEKVYLSMNQNRLRGSVAAMHRLGVVQKEKEKEKEKEAAEAGGGSEPSASVAPDSFSSMLSKLKPELQDKILTYGAGSVSAGASAPGAATAHNLSLSMPPASPAHSLGSGAAYGSNLPAHLLKSRAALSSSGGGGAGGGSGPKQQAATLALLGNPLLLSKARSYLSFLHDQPLFKNPEAINKLTTCYHINQHGSLLRKATVPASDLYKSLRFVQNQSWAKESVVKGISLAKKGSFANALKCYKHALDIEPNFTQAYVARGAAYVLQGLLQRAITEFEQALAIDPQQPYALTYLQAAKDKLNGHSGTSTSSSNAASATTSGASNSNRGSSSSAAPASALASRHDSHAHSHSHSHSHSRSHDRDRAKEKDKTRDREKDRDRARERDRGSSGRTDASREGKNRSRSRSARGRKYSQSPSSTDSSSDSEAERDADPSATAPASALAASTDPLVLQQQAVLALYAESQRARKKERSSKKEKSNKKDKSSKKSKKKERDRDRDRDRDRGRDRDREREGKRDKKSKSSKSHKRQSSRSDRRREEQQHQGSAGQRGSGIASSSFAAQGQQQTRAQDPIVLSDDSGDESRSRSRSHSGSSSSGGSDRGRDDGRASRPSGSASAPPLPRDPDEERRAATTQYILDRQRADAEIKAERERDAVAQRQQRRQQQQQQRQQQDEVSEDDDWLIDRPGVAARAAAAAAAAAASASDAVSQSHPHRHAFAASPTLSDAAADMYSSDRELSGVQSDTESSQLFRVPSGLNVLVPPQPAAGMRGLGSGFRATPPADSQLSAASAGSGGTEHSMFGLTRSSSQLLQPLLDAGALEPLSSPPTLPSAASTMSLNDLASPDASSNASFLHSFAPSMQPAEQQAEMQQE